ncbi:hypothetical protein PFAG_05059 [Plasmodium falciparum Santa Lucia]|uniref:Uncharacterized protein n=2 Tax=Plasmodium falciparum TaxID=5833 RepID=A0A024W2J9_PLAFA|nr:hypothetical protein PFTANZ_04929 [Plasmodium falciparum Tanzania (2000708)]EUT80415.1 hypothetical protein PFAG_05059 [Plasmodium falciparum Santa Lucia]
MNGINDSYFFLCSYGLFLNLWINQIIFCCFFKIYNVLTKNITFIDINNLKYLIEIRSCKFYRKLYYYYIKLKLYDDTVDFNMIIFLIYRNTSTLVV